MKNFREPRLFIKSLKHCGFVDLRYTTIRQGFRRNNSMGLTAETAVSKELTGFQDREGGFLALFGHRNLHAPILQIKDRVSILALDEDIRIFCVARSRPACTDLHQKFVRISLGGRY